jgi:hypothetical protein
MSNEQIKSLCLKLLFADNEEDIIEILKSNDYWNNQKVWRLYGDTPDNYGPAGSQANEADAALVEKITNARDARLMMKCLLKGIDPKSDKAPQTVKEAIGKFFDLAPNTDVEGDISELDNSAKTKLAIGMTMSITGESPGTERKDVYPCITIADDGEGQTPDNLPDTILSLNKSIKSEIKFTHGKFNMGGTAVLRFCGNKNLQLVISRRNPELLNNDKNLTDRDFEWGFTIVRREFPEGNRTKSWYKYLAPIENDLDQKEPKILSFSSCSLPIFPDKNEPYKRDAKWGTVIKLYNYKTKSRGHALRDSGLLRALEILLPDIGLPLRIHECRKSFKGHAGSFANNLTGIQNRLREENNSLELKEPLGDAITIEGQKFEMLIYVLKSKEATSTYRKSDKGIIFTLNGQSQGWYHERFFEKAQMGYLKDSLIVIIDCSKIDYTTQEELFDNGRDRLSTLPIRYKLEEEIEDSLKNNSILKELREKRRREKTAEKLIDSKPLEEMLKTVIKHNHTLSNLFMLGNKAFSSFKSKSVIDNEKKFQGKKFPTFFKFKKSDYGKKIERPCHINQKSRILFETDAVNDYFIRENSPGEFQLYIIENGEEKAYENYKRNLTNGIATLNITLPGNCQVGKKLDFVSKVSDASHQFNPFINEFSLFILKENEEQKTTDSKPRKKFPGNEEGDKATNNSGILLPETIREVAKEPSETQISWDNAPTVFNENSVLAIASNGKSDNKCNANGYDWYINVDNKYLIQEIKSKPSEADIIKAQFIYGFIIIGISMLYSESLGITNSDEENNISKISIEEKVLNYSISIAPVIIPIINELSKIREPQDISL